MREKKNPNKETAAKGLAVKRKKVSFHVEKNTTRGKCYRADYYQNSTNTQRSPLKPCDQASIEKLRHLRPQSKKAKCQKVNGKRNSQTRISIEIYVVSLIKWNYNMLRIFRKNKRSITNF